MGEAHDAATRLGRNANYWQTSFGLTNVQLHQVSVSLDLGDVQYVLTRGPDIDASPLLKERSVARQIDMARAYS